MTQPGRGATGNSGRYIGPYELIHTLGLGGSAKVYRGRHIYLRREAAVKVLFDPLDPDQANRFLQEARIIARLSHPRIIEVQDFNVEDNIPFLVMPYAPYGSLRDLIHEGDTLPLNEVVRYTNQIAEALQYAHDDGIIHRDIKPQNILLDSDKNVLLSDFGIAVIQHNIATQTFHEPLGTVAYISPEQLDGHPVKASDQYSTAILVYELLTGHRPFKGSKEKIKDQHRYAAPPSLRDFSPHIPVAVERVIMRALSKNPQQRYPSISAFAHALENASHQVSSTRNAGGSATPKMMPSKPFMIALCLMLLLSLSLLTVGAIMTAMFSTTVVITPKTMSIAQEYTLLPTLNTTTTKGLVRVAQLSATASDSSLAVKATGTGLTPATRATGKITFFNGASTTKTIPAGTTLSTANGVVVVTDETASMSAAHPPKSFGESIVSAYALNPGANGNIAADSLDQVYPSDKAITVQNLTAFSGGQDAQPFSFVKNEDVDKAAGPLTQAARAYALTALQNQTNANPDEVLVPESEQCVPQVQSNPKVGQQATTTKVTVTVTCNGSVYNESDASSTCKNALLSEAVAKLGRNYKLLGSIRFQVLQANLTSAKKTIVSLLTKAEGLWLFHLENEQAKIAKMVAGKSVTIAQSILLRYNGIAKADIQIPWWVPVPLRTTLPTDLRRIMIRIVNPPISE